MRTRHTDLAITMMGCTLIYFLVTGGKVREAAARLFVLVACDETLPGGEVDR